MGRERAVNVQNRGKQLSQTARNRAISLTVNYLYTAEMREVAGSFWENCLKNRLLRPVKWKTKRATRTAIRMTPTTDAWRCAHG